MKNKLLLLIGISILTLHGCNTETSNTSKLILNSEFIYNSEDVSFPSCHASTIVETPEGLVSAWFGGTHEKNKDVGIWLSRNLNGEWTKPVEIANGIQNDTLRYTHSDSCINIQDGDTLTISLSVFGDEASVLESSPLREDVYIENPVPVQEPFVQMIADDLYESVVERKTESAPPGLSKEAITKMKENAEASNEMSPTSNPVPIIRNSEVIRYSRIIS